MASRSRASYDIADAPDLASGEMTPARRMIPRAESRPAAHDRIANAPMRTAQQPFEAATQTESVPSRAPVARNSVTIVCLFLAVFVVAAGTSFLQAYLRDHRSTPAGSATRVIRIAPSADGNLDIRTDSQADRAQVPAEVPERSAPQTSSSDRLLTPEPAPPANAPVISKRFRERSESRLAVKPANKPITRSASVTRPSKPVAAAAQVRRPPERQIARGPNMPAVPLNNAGGTQPSVASQQTLPKPPEPIKTAAQSPASTSAPSNTGTNAAAPGPQSASRNVPQSAGPAQASPQPGASPNSAYVPARPLRWAAPDARSLGVSRIAQAVDIAVKIRIDESGHVTSAHALLDGSVHDPAVMAAATAVVKQWTFEPAKMQGKNVASEDTVVIHVDPKR